MSGRREQKKRESPSGRRVVDRTAAPSDWEQMLVLMERTFRKDCKKPHTFLARLIAGPCMWMFYTLGFLFAQTDTGQIFTVSQGVRYYNSESIVAPGEIYLAGNRSMSFLLALQDQLESTWAHPVILDRESDPESFQTVCSSIIGDSRPESGICVFVQEELAYDIYYSGGEYVAPFDEALVGAQYILQESILAAAGINTTSGYPLDTNITLQKTPELNFRNDKGGANLYFLIFPGVMLVLASTITMQFIMAPLSTEKFKEVVRSFVLVGVKLRVYLHQWLLYLTLNAIITAVALTGVSFAWKIFAESSAILVFISHFLAFVHLITVALIVTQLAKQEELTQSLPWLLAISSCGVGIAIIVFHDPQSLGLSLFAVFSPFVGILQYCAIYSDYDRNGFATGIRIGENVQNSGILGSLLAQLAGIVLLNMALYWYSTRGSISVQISTDGDNREASNGLAADWFEPLSSTADVLLRVSNLDHTYESPMCERSKDVPVLSQLNLEICRGEVFGYLGHNSSGKTTSIRILSGELSLQNGSVTYNFQNGAVNVSKREDIEAVRKKIGICPQHNGALHDDVSGREFLRLFARLKGHTPIQQGQTRKEAIEAEVDRRLAEIQFTSPEDADKLISTYSGGMKRKVCIALAFLADPEVVFLDEPSAGIDPFNRRQIWDMISSAKEGRSIILTTHFLDEADILSDRVGILKDGNLVACGSTLFLKHKIGGYVLQFTNTEPFDVARLVEGALPLDTNDQSIHKWALQHGTESSFPSTLKALKSVGASNVTIELTSLEQVFLETGKEETELYGEDRGTTEDDQVVDVNEEVPEEVVQKVWEPQGTRKLLSATQKVMLVSTFMLTNAWKIKGTIFLNIVQPLMFVIFGMLLVGRIDEGGGELVNPSPISILPRLAGDRPAQFFGLIEVDDFSIDPLIPTDEPGSVNEYFQNNSIPVLAGYWAENQTLQYNESFNPFALQLGIQLLGIQTALLAGSSNGIATNLVQLAYVSDDFRSDLLLLPMMLALGFSGLVFCVLDVLLLKSDNIIGLFQVSGITEWTTYQGVMIYKVATTFVPFFFVVIILGVATESVLFGNAGRWLATSLILLGYAYSTTPLGLLLAKKFIRSDFKSAANTFPGIYMTFVSLPYIAWNIALQVATEARQILLVVGDIICIVPPVAFQRGLGAILEVSKEFDDPELTWSKVYSWETRVWFSLLIMLFVGTLEWAYLYRLTTARPSRTGLTTDEKSAAFGVNSESNFGVREEITRSVVDDSGINARSVVKVFRSTTPGQSKKKHLLKTAVKGVSFGVKRNEILCMLGPNGAGKSVTMGILSGQHTAENGSIALSNVRLAEEHHSVDHLYQQSQIASCPQFDALFPKKTIREHLYFYAKIRGMDSDALSTKEHIEAIVQLLGLRNHMDKLSTDISGGYKRRTCLALSLVGYPTAIMVDECTTGLDPGARRLVWQVLRPTGRGVSLEIPAILLSTHYMEEACALADRISIFIDGEIIATGSLAELRSEYCSSYFVEIALQVSATGNEETNILEAFESVNMPATVYESLPRHFKLQIPFQTDDHLEQLADIFSLIESQREFVHIQFYAVSQMSLEQIFIDLSRRQFEADESLRET